MCRGMSRRARGAVRVDPPGSRPTVGHLTFRVAHLGRARAHAPGLPVRGPSPGTVRRRAGTPARIRASAHRRSARTRSRRRRRPRRIGHTVQRRARSPARAASRPPGRESRSPDKAGRIGPSPYLRRRCNAARRPHRWRRTPRTRPDIGGSSRERAAGPSGPPPFGLSPHPNPSNALEGKSSAVRRPASRAFLPT